MKAAFSAAQRAARLLSSEHSGSLPAKPISIGAAHVGH